MENRNKMKLPIIHSAEELAALVNDIGFLPFFANPVQGFSLEETAAARYWFPDSGDGVWEWKSPVIQKADCAYGKFFRGRAGFISKEWYPDFANFRRDGYDFDALYDDGLARHADKTVYDLIDQHKTLLSTELKRLGNFEKGGNKGFDGIITRLQMQGYVVVRAFEYKTDKFGCRYGWGVARYETSEYRFGSDFRNRVYERAPEISRERVLEHLCKVTGKDQKTIGKLML